MTLGTDTLISLGTALVITGIAVRSTYLIANVQRDLRELNERQRKAVTRSDLALWASRLRGHNPTITVPELEHEDAGA